MITRVITFILIVLGIISCGKGDKSQSSIELIASPGEQETLFRNLLAVSNNTIPEYLLNDSLAFLILPVKASCPGCRRKTIDSIVKYQDRLAPNHFIIISAKAGRKGMNGYFREQGAELPVIDRKLILDSTNQAGKHDLYNENTTIYYTYKRKVYKKVNAVPMTVKQDLQEFFSGYRTDAED